MLDECSQNIPNIIYKKKSNILYLCQLLHKIYSFGFNFVRLFHIFQRVTSLGSTSTLGPWFEQQFMALWKAPQNVRKTHINFPSSQSVTIRRSRGIPPPPPSPSVKNKCRPVFPTNQWAIRGATFSNGEKPNKNGNCRIREQRHYHENRSLIKEVKNFHTEREGGCLIHAQYSAMILKRCPTSKYLGD